MTTLLTGGSGFVGRNILESSLAGKYAIVAPRHQELELLDEAAVRRYLLDHRVEYIIHAAAKPGHRNAADPGGVYYTNTRIFFNLARNQDLFKKMIVIGSGAIYDLRHYRPKMAEEYFGQHVPADEHGFSKYVMGLYGEGRKKIVDLRVFGIYGKYEDYAIRFISNLICKALFDLPLTMKQNRKFDYIHVDDLMPVLDFFLTHETRFQAYNVTPDSAVELVALAEKIKHLTGTAGEIRVAQAGLGTEYSGDNRRLRAEMPGWRTTPLDEGIEKLHQWYREFRGTLNPELLKLDK
ncbi:MAG: NAD(P)-dependent oxidoreductase [Candidatus Firestonebacteria bacterium]|nr:NAD(P)-dependent oxidoreductase [Candidatus Firestonebacteria bacterium]